MKQTILLTLALALFAAAPAFAAVGSDEDVAKGIAVVVLYDQACAKLPSAVMSLGEQALTGISRSTVEAAATWEGNQLKDVGPVQWCALMKPVIDKTSSKAFR